MCSTLSYDSRAFTFDSATRRACVRPIAARTRQTRSGVGSDASAAAAPPARRRPRKASASAYGSLVMPLHRLRFCARRVGARTQREHLFSIVSAALAISTVEWPEAGVASGSGGAFAGALNPQPAAGLASDPTVGLVFRHASDPTTVPRPSCRL